MRKPTTVNLKIRTIATHEKEVVRKLQLASHCKGGYHFTRGYHFTVYVVCCPVIWYPGVPNHQAIWYPGVPYYGGYQITVTQMHAIFVGVDTQQLTTHEVLRTTVAFIESRCGKPVPKLLVK